MSQPRRGHTWDADCRWLRSAYVQRDDEAQLHAWDAAMESSPRLLSRDKRILSLMFVQSQGRQLLACLQNTGRRYLPPSITEDHIEQALIKAEDEGLLCRTGMRERHHDPAPPLYRLLEQRAVPPVVDELAARRMAKALRRIQNPWSYNHPNPA